MKFIAKILKFGTLFSTMGFIVCTLIQVYARFFMESAPPWTEEAARVFFIHAVGFAAGLAVRGNYYVNFDLLYQYLGPKAKTYLDIITQLTVFVLFATCAFYGSIFTLNGFDESAPSMGIPMAVPFVSTVVLGCSICLYTWLELLKTIRRKK
ncbi:TRAP transporter small permease [Pseudozobellia thermophila]|uniref:TRAP-type C4-dicarboxylate transport system, small permease component n=1 Tax=Pseudozobellia thermophila TaxID=192903 RepID=A0A1M6KTH4_9FLAO|nr:TRAP transporter small permease subunit [Pseudozobellia thermophila]SHJ62223.1 TRAP-type C4-dicarboxylate transport system, small permease component [Pseudozobellia thermophila]